MLRTCTVAACADRCTLGAGVGEISIKLKEEVGAATSAATDASTLATSAATSADVTPAELHRRPVSRRATLTDLPSWQPRLAPHLAQSTRVTKLTPTPRMIPRRRRTQAAREEEEEAAATAAATATAPGERDVTGPSQQARPEAATEAGILV